MNSPFFAIGYFLNEKNVSNAMRIFIKTSYELLNNSM